jgi:hypothetical protein
LSATYRKVSSLAAVAWRKRNLLRKIGTQENCEPCKEFAAAGMRMTHCAKWHEAGNTNCRDKEMMTLHREPRKDERRRINF